MNVLTLDELKNKRKNKANYKTDYLGLSKIGTGYLFELQDTAEYNANEAYARKWNLINIYKKLSIKTGKFIKSDIEIEKIDSDSLMDYITEMLIEI